MMPKAEERSRRNLFALAYPKKAEGEMPFNRLPEHSVRGILMQGLIT
jgi:hypothetical protein